MHLPPASLCLYSQHFPSPGFAALAPFAAPFRSAMPSSSFLRRWPQTLNDFGLLRFQGAHWMLLFLMQYCYLPPRPSPLPPAGEGARLHRPGYPARLGLFSLRLHPALPVAVANWL